MAAELKCRGYRLTQGQDISTVAQLFRTTVTDILNVNPELAGATVVQPGAVIKIPPFDDTCDETIIIPTPNSNTPPSYRPPPPVVPYVPITPVSPKLAPPPPAFSPPISSPPIARPVVLAPPPPFNNDNGGGSNTGAIVGAVIGVLAGLALIAVGVWLIMKKRRSKTTKTATGAPSQVLKAASKPVLQTNTVQSTTDSAAIDDVHPATLPSIWIDSTLTSKPSIKSKDDGINSSAEISKDPLLSLIASMPKSMTSSGAASVGNVSRGSGGGSGAVDIRAWEFDWDDVVVEGVLGEGSFGKVYKASWNRTTIAVKVLMDVMEKSTTNPAVMTLSSPALAALEKEATLMATLRHPQCVSFLGVCLQPPAIASEYCEKGSLLDVLRGAVKSPDAAAELTWHRRLRIALDAATGMLYLHNHRPQIVHRDLKSPNILIDENWRAKVADFNLSKLVEEAVTTSSAGGATNPRWLAPEVLAGSKATAEADVFAFGVVLHELLTFEIPWAGSNPWQIVSMVTGGKRLDIPSKNNLPGVNSGSWKGLDGYITLIQKCWAQNPSDRPNFDQVIDELKSLLATV